MMLDALRRLHDLDPVTAGRAIWRWWIGELAALIPPGLWRRLERLRPAYPVLEIRDGNLVLTRRVGGQGMEIGSCPLPAELEDEKLIALRRALATATPSLKLMLSPAPEQVLVRELRFPRASRRDLKRMLALEIDRQCPIDTALVRFDHRAVRRDSKGAGTKVELRLIKAETIETLVSLCASLGATAVGVAVPDHQHWGDGKSLLPRLRLPLARRLRQATTPLLAGFALLLIVAILTAVQVQGERSRQALAAQMRDAKAEVHAIDLLTTEITALRARVEFLPHERKAPTAGSILNDVARLLPDNAWLTQMEVNGHEIRIHGYAPMATTLVEVFDTAPQFTNARFRSPVIKASGQDLDRFDLSFDLREVSP